MKKILFCFIALVLVVTLAFAAGIPALMPNGPNQTVVALPAVCTVLAAAVLVEKVRTAITRQLVKLAARFGKTLNYVNIVLLRAAHLSLAKYLLSTARDIQHFAREWGKTQIKPIYN